MYATWRWLRLLQLSLHELPAFLHALPTTQMATPTLCYSCPLLLIWCSVMFSVQSLPSTNPYLRCYWLMMFNLTILFLIWWSWGKQNHTKSSYPVLLCHGTSKHNIVCCTNPFICYFAILKKRFWTPGIVHVVYDIASSLSQIFGDYRHKLITTHHELA